MRTRDYQPGEQVPGTVYRVLRMIGAGGMGTVYDVEDTTIGKRYVLKTLHSKLGEREDLARRIQHEARTLARLNHPNIVDVITAGVTADDLRLPYYLMERLSGQSLRVVLEKKGRLELPHAYHIGIDLLDALDHAHDKGVIHRDVKPDNIFLHRAVAGVTVTKLLDFGIVSMLDGDSSETAGRFLGTLRYASPEQLRGEKPTPKTDVYSAALVIFEIVAGRGPFDDEGDSRRIAAAHMSKKAPPLSRLVEGVPRELDILLGAALAKDKDTRPRDAFSFAASLRNIKRMLEAEPPRETTDSRVTAAAVLAPESESELEPESEPDADPPSLPKTTIVGMPSPTIEPPVAPMALSVVTTTQDAERVSVTNTMSPGPAPGLEEARRPGHGTEVIDAAWPEAPPRVAPVEAPAPAIQWPPERNPARSLEPQVQSMPAAPRRRRPIALGLGVATLGLAAGWIALSVRHHGATAPESYRGAAEAPSASLVRGAAGLELAVPAPTIAPPGLEDLPPVARPVDGGPVTRAAASPPVASSATASSVVVSPAAAAPARTSSSPAFRGRRRPTSLPPKVRTDRPGPGF